MNENFAGIGAFKKGFERAGFKVKVVAISEIDKYCIQTYNEIHGPVNNLGAIGSFDRLPAGVDVCTWSFPCQDISNAGHGKGMEEGTRSNYGFVFLETLRNTPIEERPKVLIMENVALLFSKKFHKYWSRILTILSECGYQNYPGKMNAKDYGVAQNRDRVFIVSVLGEYSYEYPKPFKLEKKLKDYLEPQVIEKFYLTADQILSMFKSKYESMGIKRVKEEDAETINAITTMQGGNREPKIIENIKKDEREPKIAYAVASREFRERGFMEIAPTLLSRDYKDQKILEIPQDKTICINSKVDGKQPSIQNRVYDVEGLSTAITTSFMTNSAEPQFAYGPQKREFSGFKEIAHTLRATDYKQPNVVLIPEKTKKEYAEATDGDGIYINRPYQKRGTVQKGKIHTIKTSPDDIGLVENIQTEVKKLKLVYDLGLFRIYEDEDKKAYLMNKDGQLSRIRKVTPRESWRLMDFDEEDFNKAEKLNSNTQLYKQAGNSIVVGVIEQIARMMME
jgi:DNA-cytosine methyltransferase